MRQRDPVGKIERASKEVLEADTAAVTDAKDLRRQESIRRADKRTETLRRFYAEQPRDAWAQQTEIELHQTTLPEGIAFQEVGCKAHICRIVATGRDRHAIFGAVSDVQKERKTFSRQISDLAGVVTVETFISPNNSNWPNPFSEDG